MTARDWNRAAPRIIATTLAAHVGRDIDMEHTGGGMIYLRAEVGEGGWTWFSWAEPHGDFGTVTDSLMLSTIVNGCVYSSSGEQYAVVPDQEIRWDESAPIVLACARFLDAIPAVVAAYPEGWHSI